VIVLSEDVGRLARIGLLLLTTMAACAPSPGSETNPTPSSIATPAATPASSTTDIATGPSPTERPRSTSIQTTSVASIPREFAYVEASPITDVTLWLVDLSGGAAPAAVARYTIGEGTSSASKDGKTVVIQARGERSVSALHVLHPLTGEATLLYDPPGARAFYPRLSPDGRYAAFALGRDSGWDGVWIADVATGQARQVLPQSAAPFSTDPVFLIGWSDDSEWLAYAANDPTDMGGFGPKVFIRHVADGRRVTVGRGHALAWRQQEPRILLLAQTGKGNQGAYGAAVSTYDLTHQQAQELFSIDPRVIQIAWSPVGDEFLYLTDTTSCPFRASIWTMVPGDPATRAGTIDTARQAWWSADGNTIFALVRGSGSDADVIDATTGRKIATIPNTVQTRACP
jgi:hypothetical protein